MKEHQDSCHFSRPRGSAISGIITRTGISSVIDLTPVGQQHVGSNGRLAPDSFDSVAMSEQMKESATMREGKEGALRHGAGTRSMLLSFHCIPTPVTER
jgi:hypothetical protein